MTSQIFPDILQMQQDSETFKPVSAQLGNDDNYYSPVLLRETSTSRLYRISKAGRHFLIKTCLDTSASALVLLKREYEISLSLQHHHIPYIYTYEAQSPVGPGIVMEYVEGRSLVDYIKEKPTHGARMRIFRQLLEVVAYIHKSGIIHNDLKPENILITNDGDNVKLLDFGLSDRDAHYLARTLGCTPEYASPELLSHHDNIDIRSDIYSVGCIMQRLFGNKHKAIRNKCLRQDPNDRYANADEILRALGRRTQVQRIFIPLLILLIILPMVFFLGFNLAPSAQTDTLVIAQELDSTKWIKAIDSVSQLNREFSAYKDRYDSIYSVHSVAQAEAARYDSICREFDREITELYNSALPIIKRETYTEFATRMAMSAFYTPLHELQRKYNYGKYDQKMLDKITGHVSHAASKYYDEVLTLTKSMPSINTISDTQEEEYYSLLLAQGKAYTPYHSVDTITLKQ